MPSSLLSIGLCLGFRVGSAIELYMFLMVPKLLVFGGNMSLNWLSDAKIVGIEAPAVPESRKSAAVLARACALVAAPEESPPPAAVICRYSSMCSTPPARLLLRPLRVLRCYRRTRGGAVKPRRASTSPSSGKKSGRSSETPRTSRWGHGRARGVCVCV